ncbi:hypothetical protein IIA16_00265 [bacterium]|nr:hypothetical protein [bacterium]
MLSLGAGGLLAGTDLTDDAPPPPVTNPAWYWEELPWEGKAPHQLWAAHSGDRFIVVVAELERKEVVVFSGSPHNWETSTYPVTGEWMGEWWGPLSLTIDEARGAVHMLLSPTAQSERVRHLSWGADGWSVLEPAPKHWEGIIATATDPATGQVFALVWTGQPRNPSLPWSSRKPTSTSLASLAGGGWDEEELLFDGAPVDLQWGAFSFSPGGDLLLAGLLRDGRLLAGGRAKGGSLALELVPLPEGCTGWGVNPLTPPVVAQPGGEIFFGFEARCRRDGDAPSIVVGQGVGRVLFSRLTNAITLFLLSRSPGEIWVAERLPGLVDDGPQQLLLDDSGRVHFLQSWWNHSREEDKGPQVFHVWQDGSGGWSRALLGTGANNGFSPSYRLTRDNSGTWHAWFISERYEGGPLSIVHAWLPAGTSEMD